MSDRAKNYVIAVLLVALAAFLAVLVGTSETTEDRVERIGSSIKCPVCQGEAIADSPATMATDMMALIEERVDQGATDEEIVDELLSAFSGAVLLDPPAEGLTLALWLAPLGALILGVVVVAWWRAHPGDENEDATPAKKADPRSRKLAGGLFVVVGFAGIVVLAAVLLQEPTSPAGGAAALSEIDPAGTSNETMEAVIAANADNPQISGMRLALAERYYEAGDYRAAFPHYLAVAESAGSNDAEATTALLRLGWMAFDGNGEVDAALTLFDQALQISPGSDAALYLKGRVLWCGASDYDAAATSFEAVLEDDAIDPTTAATVETDLEAVLAGEPCQ